MAKPLLDIMCSKTEPYCRYPTEVKILMDDGYVGTYVLKNEMQFRFNNLMQKLDEFHGYQFRPRKRRNRIHLGRDEYGQVK